MKILRESLINEDHWKQSDDESQMVKIQLKSIQEDVEELLQVVQDGDQFDAWVQTKIAKAQEYLNVVRDYIILGDETEDEVGPEVITDNPPVNVAPETPVDLTPAVDSEDELEMDDLMGPGPEVAGEEGDIEGAMEPAEAIPLDLDDEEEMEEMDISMPMVEYDEHPLQGWREEEADRRWARDNADMYDPDEEEYPYDDEYMMESLDSFSKKLEE